MRVERFFLFFGPTLWSFKRGETEYGIKSIPLGGYVKITGMNPEEEVPPEHAAKAYYRQPVWKRIVVIAAGPAVNIVLAFAILFCVYLVNAQQVDQKVGEIRPGTPGGQGAPARRPDPRGRRQDAIPASASEARIETLRQAGRLARMRRQAGGRLPRGDAGGDHGRPRRSGRGRSRSVPNTAPKTGGP